MKTKGKMVKEETVGVLPSRFKSCPPHTLPHTILEFLESGPCYSTDIQNHFSSEEKERAYVRNLLSQLYRRGKVVRSPFKIVHGYVYALPKDKEKIIEKLKEMVPPYVRNSLELIVNQRKLFTLNSLVELTSGDYESTEYYLDNVFCKQLRWISNGYHKSFKVYWNAKYTKEELLEEFEKELSEIHRRIKVEGSQYEEKVRELLDSYLLRLPFKVEKYSRGTPSGKYYFDSAYNLYLLGEYPLQLKVEIKNHIPNLNEIAFFWRKVREYRHGVIIPVVIAPAFPSVVYRSFGDILFLVRFDKLRQFVDSLKIRPKL